MALRLSNLLEFDCFIEKAAYLDITMSSSLDTHLTLALLPQHHQLWLALSGGLDSVVLLDLVVRYCQSHYQALGETQRQRQAQSQESGSSSNLKVPALKVIHIHHGLSPNADQWALHCQQLCQDYQQRFDIEIECQVHRVLLDKSGNIEAQARQARYQVFSDALQQDDLILMAHHSDDQAETLLLRLMRGAGSQGLAGMPQQRPLGKGQLLRPLLNYSRQQLEVYANQQQLRWVEDESNASLEFERNYLRHQVMPLLKQRWPSTNRVLSRVGQNLSDSAELNRDLAELDLEKVRQGDNSLCCQALTELTQIRQTNLLRHWLQQGGMPELEQKQWQIVFVEVIAAREDAEPCFDWGGYQLRRFRNRLYLLKPCKDDLSQAQTSKIFNNPPTYHLADLPLGAEKLRLTLPGGEFVLCSMKYQPGQETGSACKKPVLLSLPNEGYLELRYRQGGEKICLPRRGTKVLKKLLQEADIPPWQRQHLPLLWWCNPAGKERLIAVADLWFEQDFISSDGAQGWRLNWQPD